MTMLHAGSALPTIVDARFALHQAKQVGTDRQMRTVDLDHPHGQDEQRAAAIERVHRRRRQFFELVNVRTGWCGLAF